MWNKILIQYYFSRHFLSICSPNLSYRDRWLLDVFQSFFLLLSYFSHLFMPMSCLVMDTDILHRVLSYKLVWYQEMDKEKKMNLHYHKQQCVPIVPWSWTAVCTNCTVIMSSSVSQFYQLPWTPVSTNCTKIMKSRVYQLYKDHEQQLYKDHEQQCVPVVPR